MLRKRIAGARAIWLLGPLVVAAVLHAEVATGQGRGPVRIAILSTAYHPWHPVTEGFRDELRDRGLLDGQQLVLDPRAAEGDPERLPRLAAELAAGRPDLFYCVGAPAAQACARSSPAATVVFVEVADPVRVGLVQSVARPGGRVTGIANLRSELAAKRLELFREVVPFLRRVLITYDPREAEEQAALGVAREAARVLGLQLIEQPITDPLQMEPGLAGLAEGGQDGILIVQFGPHLGIAGRSLEVATARNLPTMYPSRFWAVHGALAAYGPDQHAQGRQAARLALRILAGAAPRDLPVELPDRVELVVNLKVARRLGVAVPATILLRADHLVE